MLSLKGWGCLLLFLSGLLLAQETRADAWWGEGYRSPEWVVANGGAILYYDSANRRGDVVVDLYTAAGDVIETERGKSGLFDDALAGQAYYLKAKDKKEKFKSQIFTLKRGSTNYVTLDFKKEKASFSLGASTRVLGVQKLAPKPKKVVNKDPGSADTKEEKEIIAQSEKNAESEDFKSAQGAVSEQLVMKDLAEKKAGPKVIMVGSDSRQGSVAGKLKAIFSLGLLAVIFGLAGALIFLNKSEEEQQKVRAKKENKK